jgi:hypothetical protein
VRLLLVTNQLTSINGAETYLITVGEALEAAGHDVTLVSQQLGEMAELAQEVGLNVVRDLDVLRADADGVIANDYPSACDAAAANSRTPVVFVAHADSFQFCTPPQLDGVVSAVVALNGRVARQMRALGQPGLVVRLRQPIDVVRFAPRIPPRETARRVLLLGNYLSGTRRDMVERACASVGLEVLQVGRHGQSASLHPELAILESDIVMGKGRTVLEGMACGRAAYVYDQNGGDGWVTPESYPRIETDNFGGRATDASLGEAQIAADLAAYSPELGLQGREIVIRNHASHRHAQQLVAVFAKAGAPARPRSDAIAELARLSRMQWRTESRAAQSGVEAEIALRHQRELETARDAAAWRAEVAEAELAATLERAESAEAEAARQRERAGAVEAFTRTSRYRFAVRVGQIVDRLRALARRR